MKPQNTQNTQKKYIINSPEYQKSGVFWLGKAKKWRPVVNGDVQR